MTIPRTLLLILLLISISAPVGASEPAFADTDITRVIERAYWWDDIVDANRIDVETRNGVVTLTGKADNLLSAEQATRIAESFRGVRAVVNRIQVSPSLPEPYPDTNLKLEIEIALAENPVTEVFEINTAIHDGMVTLSGTVDSWAEKVLSGRVVKGIAGVRSVKNEIAVDYSYNRPDGEIHQEIEARLANDVLIDDLLVRVAVEDDKVTLSGTVGSPAEKRRAVQDAWVTGVNAVSAEDLEVKAWARDRFRRTDDPDINDDQIRKAVRDAFRYDPRIRKHDLDVRVTDGVVTLSGIVNYLGAKVAAGQDARNVVGVLRVNNHLKVRSTDSVSPRELETRIRKLFDRDPFLRDTNIIVSTGSSGQVRLSGSVSNSYLKNRAGALVAIGAKGVTSLVNQIRYEHAWEERPDRDIRQDVEEKLFWNPFVDEANISVGVSNGVVTLKGNVDNWSAEDAAIRSAWEGGAKDVRNELTVTNEQYGPYNSNKAYELPGDLASADVPFAH